MTTHEALQHAAEIKERYRRVYGDGWRNAMSAAATRTSCLFVDLAEAFTTRPSLAEAELGKLRERQSGENRAYQNYINETARQRDEAIIAQLAAEKDRDQLAAENACLREALTEIVELWKLGDGTDLRKGSLIDAVTIAENALKSPSPRAARMLAVMKAAKDLAYVVRRVLDEDAGTPLVLRISNVRGVLVETEAALAALSDKEG